MQVRTLAVKVTCLPHHQMAHRPPVKHSMESLIHPRCLGCSCHMVVCIQSLHLHAPLEVVHVTSSKAECLSRVVSRAARRQAVAPGHSLHLQVPIRVVYLDRSMAGFGGGASADTGEINHHDFVPETAAQTTSPAVPRVHLLYRPGHFDILLHPV